MIAKVPYLLVLFLSLSFLYWLTALFLVPDGKLIVIVTDAVAISFAVAVVTMYGRKAVQAFLKDQPDVYDFLFVGICGAWLFNALDRGWRLVWRITHWEWMIAHPYIGYMLLGLSFFAAMHLLVRQPAMTGQTYRKAWSPEAARLVVVTLVVGLLVGAVSVFAALMRDGAAW